MFYVAIIVDREHDLLKAINVPFDDPKTMYFDQGLDGFPAFGIMPGSDIKSPYRLTLPERFYPEFSVVCTVAVKSAPGGFIFAVLNPSETTVQLGLQVNILDQNRMNISLFYTDVAKSAASQVIASFVVPYSIGRFAKIGIQVTADEATLYFNCQKIETANAKRHTEELRFDPASTLYIGQAGPIMKGNLDVSRHFF
ncbi:hypothetical protein V9T40_010817 [Parthenolecanium corni]|uniref:Thrombospondin-like N-terminal domain-containing protein n=1 Tax=Parthenolecanium corni TaxID=536013 RepID=A0AAN9XXJ5_9HEMI